jgi:helicase MOV-10
VNGTAKPAPYILFGPPGTGKTSTIVEAICQLQRKVPDSRILVTAQSNAACNEVVERLLKYLPAADVYRMFALSWEKKTDKMSQKLLQVSNLNSGDGHRHQFLGYWKDFYGFKVVVCTLVTAGRLVQADIKTDHFTHVFIDECGSATEASALIPIAGLVTSFEKINAHIVLAGDIKQLGPVCKARLAEKMGYGISLMERLMNRPLYQKATTTNKYDPRVITKLIRSFRSHRKIIEFSSCTFYDDDLIANASAATTRWAINWPHLPSKNFPVILSVCYGISTRDAQLGHSYYNHEEIEEAEKWVDLLLASPVNGRQVLQSDIGVISPYKRQCSKLTQRFREKRWPGIEVGTVETFQGREKPVVIISTVRSGTESVGFINNPKVKIWIHIEV